MSYTISKSAGNRSSSVDGKGVFWQSSYDWSQNVMEGFDPSFTWTLHWVSSLWEKDIVYGSVPSSLLPKGTVPFTALVCPLAFLDIPSHAIPPHTSLSTLLTVSEVLVMHAPHHSQYKVEVSRPQGCPLRTYTPGLYSLMYTPPTLHIVYQDQARV